VVTQPLPLLHRQKPNRNLAHDYGLSFNAPATERMAVRLKMNEVIPSQNQFEGEPDSFSKSCTYKLEPDYAFSQA